MKLVFTWIQWCGKWTQARLLVQKYWFKLIEMWWEFRKIIASWWELWKKLKEILDSWSQVDGDIWKKIMESILKNENSKKIIFDWFIRNSWNKEIFDKILPDYKVIFFDLSQKKAIERLLWRMYDPISWETFPSWTLENPETWTKLIKRKDDNEKSILTRINSFVKTTIPIVNIQKSEGKVIDINADQSIENVSLEMIKKLGLYEN